MLYKIMSELPPTHNSISTRDQDLTDVFHQFQQTSQVDAVSTTPLETPLTLAFYQKWLAQGYHGEMAYLANHLEMKKDSKNIDPRLNSAITVSQSYFPLVAPVENKVPARTALYAQNTDYHFWFKDKLKTLIQTLQEKFPNEYFVPFVDSGPVLERDLGYKSGLGWFGKNSCLIHPKRGSLFFVGEILTSLQITDQPRIEPLPDFCGTCQKCIEICPTQALIEPRVLKADLCISYLTIESKKTPPLELREKIGDWFYGCDLCQTVCPWNQKVFREKKLTSDPNTSTQLQLTQAPSEDEDMIAFFREILTLSSKKIQKKFWGSPMLRAGSFGLKRNALIVIANRKIKALRPEVKLLLNDGKLQELAQWTLTKIQNES